MAQKKILSLQAMRGIAVMLVVLAHVINAETRYGGGGLLIPPGIFTLCYSAVDFFFVISGFVLVTVTLARSSATDPARFFYHRVARVYPLYWFYSAIVLAIFIVRPEMVNSSQGNQVNILESFLILPQDRLPLVMVGWTLEHEMYFYAMFTLLIMLPPRLFLHALAAWTLAMACGYYYSAVSTNLAQTNNYIRLLTHPMSLEFVAGSIVALLIYSGRMRLGVGALALGVVLLLVTAFVVNRHLGDELLFGWMRPLLYGIPATLIVYGAAAVELKEGTQIHSFLVRIGDISYSVYLSHVLVISTVGRLWLPFAQPGAWDSLIGVGLMFGAVLAFGELSYRCLEAPMLRAARKIEPRIFRRA